MRFALQRLIIRQFGRALLLLTAFGALGCDNSGGLSHLEQMKKAQQEAAESIKEKGGKADEKSYPQGEAWAVDLSGMAIDDDVIDYLLKLSRVTELNLSKSTITDAQIASLVTEVPMHTLIKLDVSNTEISDAGLLELPKLQLIYEINVKGSKITPAGLEQYKKARPKHPMKLPLKVTK